MIDEELGSMPLNNGESTNPKELFEVDNIEGKTELSAEQVIIIARLKTLGDRLEKKHKIPIVSDFIKNFLTLQLSKERKSRGEFVESFKNKNTEVNNSLLDRMPLNLGK